MNKHLHHLEDLALFHDTDEYCEMLTALLFDVYRGTSLGNLTVKYDGSPCIVFGYKNRQPFISTKSFFNKTPKFFFNEQEMIDDGMPEAKRKKLVFYLERIKDILHYTVRGRAQDSWFAADVLKDPFCMLDDVWSRPNIIEYDFSWLTSDFVFSIHTTDDYNIQYTNIIPNNINNTVYLQNSGENIIPSINLIMHMKDDFRMYKTESEAKDTLKAINACIRDGKTLYSTSPEHGQLIYLKKKILNHLHSMDSSGMGLPRYKGEPTNHEGYVYKYKNVAVKLVDRLEFSMRNFNKDFTRAWEYNK
jgi:hypothetical protein